MRHPDLSNLDAISTISPSRVEELRECGLRLAFARTAVGRGTSTPWARLGQVCHEIFEAAARGELGDGELDFDARFDERWSAAVENQELAALARANEAVWGPAQSWPSYGMKRARLRRRARELARQIHLWKDADLRIEKELRPEGEVLFGRPDLVIRKPKPYRVIDYKTGAPTDDTGEVKPAYRRQLLLYAYLESRMPDGGMPQLAVVVPLRGPTIEFEIEPDEVTRLVEETHDMIERFNDHVDRPEALANPSTSICLRCPFAAQCPSLWSVLGQIGPELGALEGTVTNYQRTEAGTVSLSVEVRRGTLSPGEVRLHMFPIERFPVLATVRPGTELRLVGTRVLDDQHTIRPGGWVRIDVS